MPGPRGWRAPVAERFWSKVDKSGPDSCWNWTAGVAAGTGCASFWLDGHTRKASRVSYELTHGAIPDGLCVLHRCDNRVCVNPAHLFLGTFKDNTADMDRKGRRGPTKGIPKLGGEDHPQAKLTAQQVAEIRAHNTPGQGTAALARQYGVSEGTMSNILHGRTWKRVA